MNRSAHLVFLLGFLICLPEMAQAGTILSFERIEPSNAAENVEAQFSVEVMGETEAESSFAGLDLPAGNVLFAVTNNVGVTSSISEVYFDGGTIVGAATIFNSLSGSTDFTSGANPPNLPNSNNVLPVFVAVLISSVDAQGNPSKGVNTSSDILGLAFALEAGMDFDDVIMSLHTGSLRIGMHVRSIGAGSQSDAFVNEPPVPEPSSLMIAAGMVLSLFGIRRTT